MPESPKSREFKLPVERMGENEIKIERLLNMFMNRTSREGIDKGYQWLRLMYTYLPKNEREIMKNHIKKSKEVEKPGVPKEKTVKAKEKLLKLLEDSSNNIDNNFKKMYSEKTPLERKKILMERQSSLEVVEESFKRWKERENKSKRASTEEWFKMSLEEMGSEEIGRWKKRIGRKMEGNENIEQMRPFAEAILKCEEMEEEIHEKLWGTPLGEMEAERETKREGKPVVFLGDIEANIKKQLKDWLYEGLNKEEIEEWVEENTAGAGYTKRIIGELEEKERNA